MDAQNPGLEAAAAEPAGRHQFMRRDFMSARIVDAGISLQEQFGTRYAADFLKDNFIRFEVAQRVLLHPQQRRSYS